MEEETESGLPGYIIGQELSTLSVEELNQAITLLKDEIARLEQALGTKKGTRAAAESFFRRDYGS
uniref:DUF1192 domain-containing protein n=1 Tax=Chelativorans sp. YIM 93263 TaxID=2906648 RepID=UPI002377F63A|nr:DUF1192 domain-containing protein [Chelativorans sp. YIM 93263]